MSLIMDAIKDSISKLTGSGDKPDESKSSETTEKVETSEKIADAEPTSDDKSKEPEVKKDDEKPVIPQDKIDKALHLFDTLNNPETAGETLEYLTNLAKKAGVITKGDTPAEQKVVVKDILEQMKEAAPEESHELLDLLAPALRTLVKQAAEGQKLEVEALQKKLKAYEEATETKGFQTEVETVLNSYPAEHLPEMEKLMLKFAPPEGKSVKEYFDDLHEIVKGKETTTKKTAKREEKIKDNLEEALPSSSGKADNILVMNRNPTMAESMQAAKQGKIIKVQAG